MQRLEGKEASGAKAYVPPAKVSRNLVDEIAALSVKPEKGRVKDLARLKRAAESVAGAISEAD